MKKVKRSKKVIMTLTMVAALAMLTSIAGISAYLTGTDSRTNTFVVGDVNINLTEPSWDTDITTDLYPGQALPKDPEITNTGTNPLYAFIKISVPKKNIYTYDPTTKARSGPSVTQLFSWTANNSWTLVYTDTSAEDVNVYVYAYGSTSALTKMLAGQQSSTLFDEVKFCYAVEGQELDNTIQDIDIKAFAIQSDNLKGSDANNPAEVWQIISNQVGA